LELTQPAEFQRVLVPLFRQLARCLTSAHFQVRPPPGWQERAATGGLGWGPCGGCRRLSGGACSCVM
jgi:hypothetical protein